MDHNYVIGTLVPRHFLEPIGFVNVRHTQLDRKINETIACLLGIDFSSAIAMLAPVLNLSTRSDMLKNLIPLKVPGVRDRCKLETLRREAESLSRERNRLIHDLPYSYSPSNDSISMVRSETWTFPQIKATPPNHVTPSYLYELGNKMLQVEVWMGLRFMQDLDGQRTPHPDWLNDAAFPWLDRYEQLLQTCRKSQDSPPQAQ